MSRFINRKNEIEFLNKKYLSKEAELLILYGRRRIGKTELILNFSNGKNAVYFMGRLESNEDTIKRFNNLLIEKFADNRLLNSSLQNWDSIFDYLAEKASERIVFIFDEFPFVVERFPEIISVLQDKWDSKLKHTKIMLIFLGSSVSMMEKYALDYKSPLYGRRTGQWKVDKMHISHLNDFFPKYSIEDIVRVYACLDVIPGYLTRFSSDEGAMDNIKNKVLSKGEFFYDEVEILLREELRDPSNYMSILSAVAGGATSFNEIFNRTHLDKSLLSKYLGVLENLDILERELPVVGTNKSKLKARGALYLLKDNFFDFWFRFVYLNKQEIERAGTASVFKNIKSEIEHFVSRKFERFIRGTDLAVFNKFDKIGRWWNKEVEIDIVALNENEKEILFGECKWSDGLNALSVANSLFEKSKFVNWNRENRKEAFAIFARSFSKKISEFEGRKVYCFDLNDIETDLGKK